VTRSSSLVQHVSAPRRRTVLRATSWTIAALTLGGASACSTGDDTEGLPDAVQTDPDVALLDRVSAATRLLLDDVEAAAATARSGREIAALTALAGCLDAHLVQFAPDASPEPSAQDAPPTPDGTLTPRPDVFTAARVHLTVLTDAAGQAESGAFARLLACAAAGLVQHLPAPARKTEERR
jgi:hypothetical protein